MFGSRVLVARLSRFVSSQIATVWPLPSLSAICMLRTRPPPAGDRDGGPTCAVAGSPSLSAGLPSDRSHSRFLTAV